MQLGLLRCSPIITIGGACWESAEKLCIGLISCDSSALPNATADESVSCLVSLLSALTNCDAVGNEGKRILRGGKRQLKFPLSLLWFQAQYTESLQVP